MNMYQIEQLEALSMVCGHIERMSPEDAAVFRNRIAGYLAFRSEVAAFLEAYFAPVCTAACYQNRISACCSKDGIITFFGDVVVNAVASGPVELDRLEDAIRNPENDAKCIYLSETGCLWRVKPIVCEMFLCRKARQQVFDTRPGIQEKWEGLEKMKRAFTWPDRPVLFEFLESVFLDAGLDSPLMYIHKSPGLVRVRKKRESA